MQIFDLVQDSVAIEKHTEEGIWRSGFMNSPSERQRLQDILAEHPDKLAEVLAVWGDKPTVPDPEPPGMPEPPEGWEPPPDPMELMELLKILLGVDE